jgi:exonuclease III
MVRNASRTREFASARALSLRWRIRKREAGAGETQKSDGGRPWQGSESASTDRTLTKSLLSASINVQSGHEHARRPPETFVLRREKEASLINLSIHTQKATESWCKQGEIMIVTTWNMQGFRNAIYLSNVAVPNNFAQPDVLCLQECGNFGTILANDVKIFAEDGGISGMFGDWKVKRTYMKGVFWENTWAQGGVAILTKLAITKYGILRPAIINGFNPRNPRFLPWVTVLDPHTNKYVTVFSIHSPAVGQGTTEQNVQAWNMAQIQNIVQLDKDADLWLCAGDYNVPPGRSGNGIYVVSGPKETHQSGGLLDYVITNIENVEFIQPTSLSIAADHFPQTFSVP